MVRLRNKVESLGICVEQTCRRCFSFALRPKCLNEEMICFCLFAKLPSPVEGNRTIHKLESFMVKSPPILHIISVSNADMTKTVWNILGN